MTEFEFRASAARCALQSIEHTRDQYVRTLECLGTNGSVRMGTPPVRNPAALSETYSRMLVKCEAHIRAFRAEYAEYL
jgi:hypothetical protein